ncbi:putative serpin-Z6A [Triticum dicoccoides]|uniref:putative serpin-Z6A n=1 Tax=Triticum dicoccoides TaxID=85692 RepID=UPI00189117CF|nr:putative serpin-Z6A [Triticum dicoccoides]
MQFLKPRTVRLYPKLRRWILTDAASSGPGLQPLALALNKRLADDAGKSNKNLVFSPLSICAALSLVAAGARERTLAEMLDVLGARSRDDLAGSVRALAEQALADQSWAGGPHVSFACAVWHDKTRPLKPGYADAAVKSYKAQTCAVDFHEKPKEAGEQINAWVAASTNKLIPSIVDPDTLSNQTDLVVANAIYFKGKWDKPFDEEDTKEDKFHRRDSSTIDVPFMRGWGKQRIACHEGFKVLQLRYQRGLPSPTQPPAHYSMCIFLPDDRDGLSQLTDRMAGDPDFLREHLPTSTVLVGDFRLPKFKLAFDTELAGVFHDLGLKDAFDPEKADFTDMAEGAGRPLALEEMLHKAVIEVNEEGTEAAAVTAALMFGCASGYPPPCVDFVADHPFAFFVMEEASGAIMFAGHVLDPSSE